MEVRDIFKCFVIIEKFFEVMVEDKYIFDVDICVNKI